MFLELIVRKYTYINKVNFPINCMELSNDLSKKYLECEKKLKNIETLELFGKFKVTEELLSDEYGDIFKIDMRRSCIELQLVNLNTRAHDSFVLARLDINDREHKNPDGVIAPKTHIHIYKEGYGARFAYNPEDLGFTDLENVTSLILQFLDFCKIKKDNIKIQEVLN